nr:NAD-binding protein [Mycobacterium leprae]
MRNYAIVIGYGTKGKTAVTARLSPEAAQGSMVVVDIDRTALDHASTDGLVTVHGDATKSDVLRLAGASMPSSIVVATGRDDTAVLVILTVR